jgi:nitrogen regulatory protein P-II 2
MNTVALRRVTIIAEALLEARLVRELRGLGARGYTVTEARGQGSRGIRASDWEGRNVKLETIVSPDVADRILAHVADRYFAHHAVIVSVERVEVLRGDKYV